MPLRGKVANRPHMSDTAAVEQSPQIVETPPAAPVTQTLPEPERNLAVDLALAHVAGDKTEIARITELSKAAPESEPVKPAETPVATEVVETPVAEVTQEEEPATEESGAMPTPKEPDRFRFKDPEDKAIAMLAKSQGISLAKAAVLRAQITGETKPVEEVHQEPAPDPTIIALEAEVAKIEQELRATHKADAMDESLPEIQIRLSRENAKLESARSKAMALADMRTISQQESLAQSQAVFDQQVETVRLEAAKEFPQLNDAKSPLRILCDARAKEMQDSNHPDHAELFKPSIVRFLAEKVAPQIGLAPVSKPTAVPAKPAEKPPARPAAAHRGSTPPPPALSAEVAIAALREEATRAIAGGHFAHGKNAGLGGTIIL